MKSLQSLLKHLTEWREDGYAEVHFDALVNGGNRTLGELLESAANELRSLTSAITEARATLAGDSNDAEHDALLAIVEESEPECPECARANGPHYNGPCEHGGQQ